MDFFISPAFAQGGAASEGSIVPTLIMIGIVFAVMYFMIIRPQQKRQKAHKQLVEDLEKGNEVITAGGITGIIRKVGENFVIIEVSENVEMRIQKNSVTTVVPKGSLEAL